MQLQVPRTSYPKSTAKSVGLKKEVKKKKKKNPNVKWKNHKRESKTASQRHHREWQWEPDESRKVSGADFEGTARATGTKHATGWGVAPLAAARAR